MASIIQKIEKRTNNIFFVKLFSVHNFAESKAYKTQRNLYKKINPIVKNYVMMWYASSYHASAVFLMMRERGQFKICIKVQHTTNTMSCVLYDLGFLFYAFDTQICHMKLIQQAISVLCCITKWRITLVCMEITFFLL